MAKLIALDLDPAPRKLRQFGWIALVGFGALAALAWLEWGLFAGGLGAARPWVAAGLGGLGALSALFSLVYPRANRALYVTLSVIGYPIGFVVSHAILALLFFGMFAPMAIVFRIIGRDALRRRTRPAGSQWQKARPPRPKSDYFKQY